jgi:hypothetical protein
MRKSCPWETGVPAVKAARAVVYRPYAYAGGRGVSAIARAA